MKYVQRHSVIEKLAKKAIRGYQRYLSPLWGARCIYIPSCSEYARQALERYGFCKGMLLTIGRIVRCHPYNAGGYDPVP